MAPGSKGVNEAHLSFSGLAFARRATAEECRLRALATEDPAKSKIYEALGATYDRLAEDLDRAAETTKRVDARTKTIRAELPDQSAVRSG
jgi:hypothetical protein